MSESNNSLRDQMIAAVKTCFDPEIPVDVWELGLIYELSINDKGIATLKMTLTSPMCPVAESLPMEVLQKIQVVDGVNDVDLQVVWDPPWSKEMMSEEARFALDMF
jgi:FeS assembly SUF system protein